MRTIILTLFILSVSRFFAQNDVGFEVEKSGFIINAGGGWSSIPGYGVLMEIGLKKNSNNYFLRSNYNSQVGNIDPDNEYLQVIRDRYNDKFFELAAMYGRSISHKFLIIRPSVGISYGLYVDKILEYSKPDTTVSFIEHTDDYHVYKKARSGLGAVIQTDIQLYFTSEIGIGVSFYYNMNGFKGLIGTSLMFCAVLPSKN